MPHLHIAKRKRSIQFSHPTLATIDILIIYGTKQCWNAGSHLKKNICCTYILKKLFLKNFSSYYDEFILDIKSLCHLFTSKLCSHKVKCEQLWWINIYLFDLHMRTHYHTNISVMKRSDASLLTRKAGPKKSLKIPEAFLICSGVQQNFAHTFVLTFSTDLPPRIFKLISNE